MMNFNYRKLAHLCTSKMHRQFFSCHIRSRLVLLLDEAFDFIAATDRLKNLQTTSLSSNLKHPKSTHIAAKYSLFHHENVDYNFNAVGEFELNLAAASGAYTLPITECVEHELFIPRRSNGGFHSIMIMPDKIILHNLVEGDIPLVVKKILMSSSTLSVDAINQLLKSSAANSTASASVLTDTTFLITVSSAFPISNSLRTLKWFSNELLLSDTIVDSNTNSHLEMKKRSGAVSVLVADSLGQHPQCTNVLVLPADKCYENVSSVEVVRNIISDLRLAIHTHR